MDKNQILFQEAKQVIPGGVNSPARAFKSVGGTPLFIEKAEGAYLWDANGNKYIDLINSWGPMILGHAFPAVKDALQEQIQRSFSYGAPTEIETKMAELVVDMMPSCDMVRMVNSGTEACLSVVRLARGFTNRNKIVKFIGNYHGHSDSFLKSAGSGLATLSIQEVPGVPNETLGNTLLANYNDLDSVRHLFEKHAQEIAAIIVEPVAGNMGCIPPEPGFLEGLRKLCTDYDSLLIFDEVMTGFRLAKGGAQEKLNINPDLSAFGKVIGGGLPVGAFGGRRDIMEHIAPLGNVYQAGTLSGNPLAMWAGYTQVKYLKDNPEVYRRIDDATKEIATGLEQVFRDKSLPVTINRLGSMMSLHFGSDPVRNFDESSACNQDLFSKFFHHMLNQGVYLPPSGFETWFISNSISSEDIDHILNASSKFSI